MFQTHCYDSWLSPAAKQSAFDKWSQLGGTLPAPLFLFLAGVSLGMTTERMRGRGTPSREIARTTIKRGAEILGLGLLFRVQMFVLGYRGAPWTDLLRVDILNMIGVSIMAMGVLCWCISNMSEAGSVAAARTKTIWTGAGVALGISLITPLVYGAWRPRFLPWFLESYVNGVHIFDKPQPWLFPFFPWAGFAFAGLAAGSFLITDWAHAHETKAVGLLAAIGAGIAGIAWGADKAAYQLYAVYDFWHTSPNFFAIRVGILLAILGLSYGWCRWGLGTRGFSPLIQLGKCSLLVYWVHINFVYTGLSIMQRNAQSIPSASFGLLIIFISMVLLSLVRTRIQWRRSPAKT